MELKDLLGESYKDGMTLEEINQALADKKFVDAQSLPKSVSKEVFDRTASELAAKKKELDAIKATNMTAEELVKKATEEANAIKTQYAREMSKLRVREVFTREGLTEKDYGGLLDTLATDDEAASRTVAEMFVGILQSQKAATEKSIREQLLKTTPTPPSGEPPADPKTQARLDYEKAKADYSKNPNDRALGERMFLLKESLSNQGG